jgi:branched-chain amino acid transport system permease protein
MIEIIFMGIFQGGIYAIAGLGLSLIFAGIRNTMNVSHGQMIVLGSYLAYALVVALGLDPLLTLVVVIPIMFGIGFVIQYGFLNRVVLRETAGGRMQIILGVGLIIENSLLLIFNPDPKSLSPFAKYSLGSLKVLGISIPIMYLIDFLVSLGVMVIVYLFMKKTYMGIVIRAASEDYVCVQHFGVNYKKIFAFTFGFGCILAAIAGVLTGITFSFEPASGGIYMNASFSVLVLGGIGSMRGALTGGVILGIIQALAAYYAGITYAYLISSIITLFLLAIRPEGIFGYKI